MFLSKTLPANMTDAPGFERSQAGAANANEMAICYDLSTF
jgi:hypothetical protein